MGEFVTEADLLSPRDRTSLKYPWRELKEGQAFVINDQDMKKTTLASMCGKASKTYGKRFVARTTKDGRLAILRTQSAKPDLAEAIIDACKDLGNGADGHFEIVSSKGSGASLVINEPAGTPHWDETAIS